MLTLEHDLDYLSRVAAQQLGGAKATQRFWSAASVALLEAGKHSYFQPLALCSLGQEEQATNVLTDLDRLADETTRREPKLDCFATSLPNRVFFHEGVSKRNRLESLLLEALARHGRSDGEKVAHLLRRVVAEDPNHLFAAEMLSEFEQIGQQAAEVAPEI